MAVTLLIVMLSLAGLRAEWSPPPKPNPLAILEEARADVASGRHEDALAKYVWFHHNALKVNKALYGVRNSYAVSEWAELGKVYAPALAKIRETRDAAVKDVKSGTNARDAFNDVAAINKALREDGCTHELFLYLDAKQSDIARQVYRAAQTVLISKKEYKLCGKYIDIKETLPLLTRSVEMIRKVKKLGGFAPHENAEIDKLIIDECVGVIAILAINSRDEDAIKVANALRKTWDDRDFHAALDKGLKGEFPKP